MARVLFSAKESVFKAVFPMIRTQIDFHDIGIQLSPEDSRIIVAASAEIEDCLAGAAITGGWVISAHHVFTTAWVWKT